jgi:hypothetical protein
MIQQLGEAKLLGEVLSGLGELAVRQAKFDRANGFLEGKSGSAACVGGAVGRGSRIGLAGMGRDCCSGTTSGCEK